MTLAIGAIADDFTGALDLANNLVRAGLRVVQVNGVPGDDVVVEGADAVVVALKTRTAPVEQAVEESLAALAWLQARQTETYYVKYCSTFDSTPEGNIGPVIDAIMDELDVDIAIASPAFPETGRTLYNGNLFVAGVRLDESSMRTHPLTPMTDANIVRVLEPQTRRTVGLIAQEDVAAGSGRVTERLDRLRAVGVGIVVVDTISNDDVDVIAEAVAHSRLVTGSSALGLALPKAMALSNTAAGELPDPCGSRAIVAGSVSAATNEQVDRFTGPRYVVDPFRILAGDDVVSEALAWAGTHLGDGGPILVYSTAMPEDVAAAQAAMDPATVGRLVEDTLAEIAVGLVTSGVGQLIVAGGETSGACVQALGIRELRIGRQIDPGVPWAYGRSLAGGIHIALKSGNFGRPDIFTQAFEEHHERD